MKEEEDEDDDEEEDEEEEGRRKKEMKKMNILKPDAEARLKYTRRKSTITREEPVCADVMHTWRRLETVAGSQIRRSAS
nr:hypothetical protein BaRGS_006698 [Batillaria attramentaria]